MQRFYADLEERGVAVRYTHRQAGEVQWRYNQWLAEACGPGGCAGIFQPGLRKAEDSLPALPLCLQLTPTQCRPAMLASISEGWLRDARLNALNLPVCLLAEGTFTEGCISLFTPCALGGFPEAYTPRWPVPSRFHPRTHPPLHVPCRRAGLAPVALRHVRSHR